MADPNPLAGMPLAESLANNLNESLQWMTRLWGSTAAAPLAGAESMLAAQSSLTPGLPSMLMPTFDPKELDKRITDLRTVAHWLDMNRTLLHTTIQALEMQRNAIVAMHAMGRSAATGSAGSGFGSPDPSAASAEAARPRAEGAAGAETVPFNPALWWNALQEQFARVASAAASEAQHATGAQDPPAATPPDRNASGP
jgi:uncharacterized protein involved in copper resistance